MMKRQTIYFAVLSAVIAASSCAAATYELQTLTLYWENDGTFLKPNHDTDRHYTNGIRFAYTHQPNWDWLKKFASWNNFGDGNNAETAMGYFFGQNLYTPDHADNPAQRRPHDRVFAGWLYGGAFAQRATTDELETFELNLGMIGPAAQGGEVQTFIHKVVNQAEPEGWDKQLGNEFAIDVTWLKRQLTDGLPFKHTPNFDSHIEYGFTAGSLHRNATLGVVLRWGCNLPNDFGPGRLEAPASAMARISPDTWSVYVFGRAAGKLVQYDRFLSGLTEEPVVGVFQVGIVGRYNNSLMLGYSQTFLTHDYKKQPAADSYGALTLTYFF